MLKALIFDVDGTLALTEEAHRHAFNAVFQEIGWPFQWDRVLYGALLKVAGGKERINHYLSTHQPDLFATVGPDDIQDLHRRKTQRFQQMLAEGRVPLRPGVSRLVGEAWHRGLMVGIATTTHSGNLDTLLLANCGVGVVEKLDCVCTGGDVTRKKPAPDLYLCALDALGLAAADCLAIEDSAVGLRAARAAGIPTLITINDYTCNDDFSDALAVVDGLGEPGRPATGLAGYAGGDVVIDLDLLASWHATATSSHF